MLEEVVIGWREVRWIWQMRQTFIVQFIQFWSIGCAMGDQVLSWRIGPFLLTNAGCRHCSFQYISFICWAYYSDVMVLMEVRKGFPGGSACKNSAWSVGDLGSIPGLGRSPEEGKGYPFLYSGLEQSMDNIVLGVAKSWTWLSGFHFSFSLEISSVLIPAAYHQRVTMTIFMV